MDEKESFEEILTGHDIDKLNDLKRFIFEESIKLDLKEKEIKEKQEKFISERVQFVEEMKQINLRCLNERKRLKDEELFFDKKMEILKSGFASLEEDRKKFEKEKLLYEAGKGNSVREDFADAGALLFAGVNSQLALRKRYRDLLKIFHPDNLCGDTKVVTIITKEYEALKEKYDYPFKMG